MHHSNLPQPQAILPAKEYVEMLNKILEMNQIILEQNASIVRCVTMPTLVFTGESKDAPTL